MKMFDADNLFPFPSNGTAQRNVDCEDNRVQALPFPFPSTGIAHLNLRHEFVKWLLEPLFPFPSTGTAHHNEASCERMRLTKSRVSIPFNRDSASLQKVPSSEKYYHNKFRFPSTGTAQRNTELSIAKTNWRWISFDSLQPGERNATSTGGAV